MRKVKVVLWTVVGMLLAPMLSLAEDSVAVKAPVQTNTALDSATKALTQLSLDEEKRMIQWDMGVVASFKNDFADGKSESVLNISTDFSKGGYPREFRFVTTSSVELEASKLDDEVTGLLLNYDYYIHPHVETYAFMERFSDTYMGIDQRFEFGIGLKFEYACFGLVDSKDRVVVERARRNLISARAEDTTLCKKTPKSKLDSLTCDKRILTAKLVSLGAIEVKKRTLEHVNEIEAAKREINRIDQSIEKLPIDITALKEPLHGKVDKALTSIRKRKSRVKLGLALSIFRELEKANTKNLVDTLVTIDTLDKVVAVTDTTSLSIDPTERYRWVIRPSVAVRITQDLEIKGYHYWKLPLSHPGKIDGCYDIRKDASCAVKWDVAKDGDLEPKVSIKLSYDFRTDSHPPSVEHEGVWHRHRDRHETYKLEFTVKL
ncbi:MAG: hypothetical protein OEV49_04320 [candidate division Zixibacteria bacterium]|nr:hypothetical protein [candidate division Zixibacteria bacterium]MDH3936180.1 hypothetical protein [candidate division Zixibacteria bacterium]MDH4032976.1 hypothetical protein [candidate division Zixibacteria bacterium]